MFRKRTSPQEQLTEAERNCQKVILLRIEECKRAREYQLNNPDDKRTIETLYGECDRISVEEKCCIAKQLCQDESVLFCSTDCKDVLYGRTKDSEKRKECANSNLKLSNCLNRYFRHVADRSGNYSTFKPEEDDKETII